MNIQIDALRKYVEKIAKKIIDDDSSKIVFEGVIKSIIPGYYEVQLVNGNETSPVRAESLYTNKVFSVEDCVYLIQATNNTDVKYFIVGLSSTIEQNFANLSEWERFIGDGTKVVDTLNITAESNSEFINAVRHTGIMSFSAKVKTSIKEKKDFGFEIVLTFEDASTKTIKFSHQSFVGQPWNLQWVMQKKIIDIGPENTLTGIEIVPYSTDFAEDDSFEFKDVSLESGEFLVLINDFSVTLEKVSKKDYLNKNDTNGIVEIKAKVKYENQILDTKALKYYWFVEDANSTVINSIGGDGWHCLNDFENAKIITENGIKETDVIIYKTDDNILTINYEKANAEENPWLPRYENKIKCVIGYQLANAESEPISVYNFEHEEYDVSIEKVSGEIPILYSDEFITLEAKYSTRTIDPTGKPSFKWYKSGEDDPLGYNIKEGDKDVFSPYTESTIKIYGENGKENSADGYTMKSESEGFYCEAYLGENLIGTSNIIIVSSKVAEIEDLQEKTNYVYWIETASNIRFISEIREEEIKDENSSGGTTFKDSYIYYKKEEENSDNREGKLIEGSSLSDLKNNSLFEDKENGEYYLYYTEQKIVIDKNRNNNIYRYNDYFYPKILRYVNVNVNGSNRTVTDLATEGSIEKLNTFNELTNGGRAQGIEYTSATYELTQDLAPDNNKLNTGKGYYKKVETYEYKETGPIVSFKDNINYYIKKEDGSYEKYNGEFDKNQNYYTYELVKTDYTLRPKDSSNYVLGTDSKPVGFKSGEEYYEEDGGDLYINASFIRSGHLEVADGEETVFSADIDTGAVTFGGFHVKGDHFVSGNPINTGERSVLVSPGYGDDGYAFWAGPKTGKDDSTRPFWVKNDGTIQATKLKISISTGDIDGLEDQISGIQSDVKDVQDDVSDIDGKVTTLNTNVTTLQSDVDNVIKPNMAFEVNSETGFFTVKNAKKVYFGTEDLIIESDNLTLDEGGNLTVKGTIEAKDGTIGGFHITGTHLASGETNEEHAVMLSGKGIKNNDSFEEVKEEDNEVGFVFWAGRDDSGNLPFWIKKSGHIYASRGTIAGWTIDTNNLVSGTVGLQGGLTSSDTDAIAIWAGDADKDSANLKIFNNGKIESKMSRGDIFRVGTIYEGIELVRDENLETEKKTALSQQSFSFTDKRSNKEYTQGLGSNILTLGTLRIYSTYIEPGTSNSGKGIIEFNGSCETTSGTPIANIKTCIIKIKSSGGKMDTISEIVYNPFGLGFSIDKNNKQLLHITNLKNDNSYIYSVFTTLIYDGQNIDIFNTTGDAPALIYMSGGSQYAKEETNGKQLKDELDLFYMNCWDSVRTFTFQITILAGAY